MKKSTASVFLFDAGDITARLAPVLLGVVLVLLPLTFRRELGLAGATAAFAPGLAAQDSAYQGALDGFENRVEIAAFDPVVWSRSRYQDAPLRMTFQASERQAAERWQSELRGKVTELIGGLPSRETPLQPQTRYGRDDGHAPA